EQRWREGDRAAFSIDCSSGTYVRSLIADLGDAYCEELRRTRVGPFDVADADPTRVLPLDQALGFLPRVVLDADAGAPRPPRGGPRARRGAAPAPGPRRARATRPQRCRTYDSFQPLKDLKF